jgi:hypothetical protein
MERSLALEVSTLADRQVSQLGKTSYSGVKLQVHRSIALALCRAPLRTRERNTPTDITPEDPDKLECSSNTRLQRAFLNGPA